MAITGDDLLDYAIARSGPEASETELRSSLSRAYYSAFHALLPLLENLPPSHASKSRDVTHFEVTERLKEWRVEAVCPALNEYRDVKARAMRSMDTARAKRVIADYRLGQTVSSADCRAQLERVRQVVRAATTLKAVLDDHKSAAQA